MNKHPTFPRTLRLGARGSLLSRRQSESVARELERIHPGLRVELVIVTTSGDRITDRPLHEFGGKGLFTKELEEVLLRREVDFAVHSYKDVPVTMPLVQTAELVMAAIPRREDVRDVLVTATESRAQNSSSALQMLGPGARVGTSSLRRRAQLLAARPDLQIVSSRGNVDTRIRKLQPATPTTPAEYDGVILALAGIRRAALWNAATMHILPETDILPAAGQGALALQCHCDAADVRAVLAPLHDPRTGTEVRIEREVVRLLHGDCHSPIGALARLDGESVQIHAVVAGRDGEPPVIRAEVRMTARDGRERAAAAARIVELLLAQGAERMLAAN